MIRRPGRRGPAPSGRQFVVSLSGPDGAGKTTVLRGLLDRFGNDRVRAGYTYGCVVCRRVDRPSGVAGVACAAGQADRRRSPVARPVRPRVREFLRRLHGLVDAAELTLRLAVLRAQSDRAGTALVVTDRGPLDGLAKYDPPPRSLLARGYLTLASQYDLLVLLDAPADVLALRDGEHRPAELDHWRMLYRRWAGQARAAGAAVHVVDTADRSADTIVSDIIGTLAAAGSMQRESIEAVSGQRRGRRAAAGRGRQAQP